MKTTNYFHHMKSRPDRAIIKEAWIMQVMQNPEYQIIQSDGRIRMWSKIPEAGNRYLRVVLLPDGQTIHNAFFDRNFQGI